MHSLQATLDYVPAMTDAALDNARAMEKLVGAAPQYAVETHHVIHGGMYCRTILLPAGHILTGALVKVPTLLTVNGCVSVYLGDAGSVEIEGHAVLPASPGRKQVFVSHTDTHISMVFATNAQSVEEAEGFMTDEADILMSRSNMNTVVVTGE
tara:strand:+ start:435 stop:893 length:459 start_codon:yes stop_codon:yes gene_type:complete